MKEEGEGIGPLPSAFPVAIVGIGCRFPGARGPEQLWRNLIERRCSVTEVPEHRIDLGYSVEHYFDSRLRIPGRISSCKAGFVEHPEKFDPVRFGLTPRDAAAMEPQARMMLEVTWDAIEDGGLPFERLRGERVAVFVGHTAEDFSRERIGVLGEDAAMRSLDVRTAVGYAKAAISGRISHLLDLRGPSMTLDTACSSSLYATHQACLSLWLGESKLALAGGVNLFLTPEGSLALSRSGMMAADGCCKAFDARADGFVRAEGAGAVVLRPLADAIENEDRIYAVIRGTGISADGRDGGHMMAPGREGQAQAMRDAYRRAELSPGEVDFLEAHGTGTPIGDPVEAASLGAVMGEGRRPDNPLRISSIKGNIGHSESASGMAGLIKAALAVQRRLWPGQLHFETPSPAIDWENLPIEVQVENADWPHSDTARAAVNSFGISGTNAHVILEGPPRTKPRIEEHDSEDGYRLMPFSAHDPAALDALAGQFLELLRGNDSCESRTDESVNSAARDGLPAINDLGHTLARRKSHFNERLAIVADSTSSLTRELEGYLAGNPSPACARAHRPGASPRPLIFVFPGQGGQWMGMGRDLLGCQPTFRASIEAWDEAFRPYVKWSLLEVLSQTDSGRDPFSNLSVIQPVFVALQASLAEWLTDRGARPEAVVGQSVGEISAAYVAGILSRGEAARLACLRGAAVARVSGQGAMGLVGLSEHDVQEQLRETTARVEIAGQSAPSMTLVAGDQNETLAFLRDLAEREIFARPLDVDFASHCFHMDALLDDFSAQLGALSPGREKIPFYSSVRGERVSGQMLSTDYWLENLRQRVRFVDAIGASMADAEPDFVEISPHPTGTKAIEEIAACRSATVNITETLRRGQPGEEALLRTLAALFAHGHSLEMDRLHPNGQYIGTPLYPHQLRTLWFGQRRRRHGLRVSHPLLGKRVQDPEDERIFSWEALVDTDSVPAMELVGRHSCVRLPPSLCSEIALATAAAQGPGREITLQNLTLHGVGPMVSRPADARFGIQVKCTMRDALVGEVHIFIRPHGPEQRPWQSAAAATFSLSSGKDTEDPGPDESGLESVRLRCNREVGLDWPRAIFERAHLGFPRRLDSLRSLHLGHDEFLAKLDIPPGCQNDVGHFHVHPALTEMAMALAGAILEPEANAAASHSTIRCVSRRRCDESMICHGRLTRDPNTLELAFHSLDGEAIAQFEEIRLDQVSRAARSDHAATALSYDQQAMTLPWLPDWNREGHEGDNKIVPELTAALAWSKASLAPEADSEGRVDFIAAHSEQSVLPRRASTSCHGNEPFVAGYTEGQAVFQIAPHESPGKGEIAVDVHSAAISQLDIRQTLGLIQGNGPRLGREFSGVVRALGSGVSNLKVGQRVFGLARGTVCSQLIASAQQVARIPDHISDERAAALPLPFLLAHHVLGNLANIEPGSRVLLMAGAGGVGLALAQVAAHKGARVLALASSAARREALLHNGAEQTCSSEPPLLSSEALQWSGGSGFDTIVSALDDPRLEAAVELLAPGGTFVDIRPPGHRTFAKSPPLGGNRSFASFDFDAWLDEDTKTVSSLFGELTAELTIHAAEKIPLTPFPVVNLQRAIRFVCQNRSVGRVVLDLHARRGISTQEEPKTARLSPHCVHWLSGPEPARVEAHALWLRSLGARRLIIHSTRASGTMQTEVGPRLERQGLSVEFCEGPIRSAIDTALRQHSDKWGSVTHLCDASVLPRSRAAEEFAAIREIDFATKRHTDMPFMLVVYAFDLLDSSGDSEWLEVAAIARTLRVFADATCRRRRAHGLRAASIAYVDPIRGTDLLSPSTRQTMEHLGLDHQGTDGLVVPQHPEDRKGLCRQWRISLGDSSAGDTSTAEAMPHLDLIQLGSVQRRKHLKQNMLDHTAAVLALSSEARERFDSATALVEMGLDSLMAVELSIQVEKEIGHILTAQLWATRPGLDDLVDYLDRAIEEERADS